MDVSLGKQGNIRGSAITIIPYENDLFVDAPKPDLHKPVWDPVPIEELRREIKETGRLFVRNLAYDCTEAELLDLFSSCGTVSEIHLSFDVRLQRGKGFAFVTYLFPDEALVAFNKLDKSKFKNRLLHILPGRPREVEEAGDVERGGGGERRVEEGECANEVDEAIMSEFQKKRQSELKSMASVSHNWNTLFVSADAVATYLSARFGVSKERLLDATSKESAAVRIAHGEAQVVHEIRDFLQRHGVRLELLSPASGYEGRRDKAESQAASTHRQVSGSVFLIKNLPVGTKEEEVASLVHQRTLKGAHSLDPPRRILVPPLGITAIVEYAMPQIARLAYKALAYEPYKGNILYVQWAPEGILSPPESRLGDEDEERGKERLRSASDVSSHEDVKAKFVDLIDADKVDEPNNFDVDIMNEDDFSCSKKLKRTEGSGGGGEDKEEFSIVRNPAEVEVSASSSLALEGPHLTSQRKPMEVEEHGRVVLVRNVAFQANQSEVTALFKPIGGLVKVRMPLKPSGGHRGFAFVEFATEDQAKVRRKAYTRRNVFRSSSSHEECDGDVWGEHTFDGTAVEYGVRECLRLCTKVVYFDSEFVVVSSFSCAAVSVVRDEE
ncbi:unnamed protein product [Hydatigera taeniaeformis]|uniref:RNA-binding protein 19 n=1 Tax=Hydatigena taeniaeformis TaxID=6205 RepID=A0A0R3WLA4_HYDTA|nr:unnamed protein product [Hydatigera taeniaeformis]